MSKIINSSWLLLALRLMLAGIFIYAGCIKITNPLAFADSIATFKILPAESINLLALGLPPFEILIGIMLIVGSWKRDAALAILGLCIVFCLVLAQALIRGLAVDCGCFGSSTPSVVKTWLTMGRDLVLTGIAGFVYYRSTANFLVNKS
jgi:uncharacterized membrane protein YphA (DoxX/SURF4 family)